MSKFCSDIEFFFCKLFNGPLATVNATAVEIAVRAWADCDRVVVVVAVVVVVVASSRVKDDRAIQSNDPNAKDVQANNRRRLDDDVVVVVPFRGSRPLRPLKVTNWVRWALAVSSVSPFAVGYKTRRAQLLFPIVNYRPNWRFPAQKVSVACENAVPALL